MQLDAQALSSSSEEKLLGEKLPRRKNNGILQKLKCEAINGFHIGSLIEKEILGVQIVSTFFSLIRI